jgi:hypothetical protein
LSKSKLGLKLMAMTLLPVLLLAMGGVLSQSLLAEPGQYQEVVFNDSAAHSGPGQHTTIESKKYSLVNGGVKWADGAVVKYKLVAPTLQQEAAVMEAVATLNAALGGNVRFERDNTAADVNPCVDGAVNTIDFSGPGDIDGDGGVLASAAACFNTKTKVIVGFRMRFDFDDFDMGEFDVKNVGTHEMGHVVGLAHVNGSKDGCLTMYKFSGLGETHKSTLGWGDLRGLDKLYDTGNPGEEQACDY